MTILPVVFNFFLALYSSIQFLLSGKRRPADSYILPSILNPDLDHLDDIDLTGTQYLTRYNLPLVGQWVTETIPAYSWSDP